jgi:hypothetical protein
VADHFASCVYDCGARIARRGNYLAGTLLREAAHLADVDPIPHPDQTLLKTLRRDAITRAGTTPSPAELAAAVQRAAPDDTPTTHTAALIWWYALLTWGANAA